MPYQLNKLQNFLSKVIIPAIIATAFFIIHYFLNYEYQLFSFLGLIVTLSCFLLALIIFSYSRLKVHAIWGLFNIVVAVWGLGCFLIGTRGADYINAVYSWKVFILGITFIPVFCYHFLSEFCNVKSKKFLIFSYVQAIFFSTINLFSDLLAGEYVFLFNEFYYLKANLFYSIYFLIWVVIVLVSFRNLFKYYRISTGVRKVQSAYLFYGMLIGFLGGSTTAPQAWGFYIYPGGLFLTCIYAAVSTYAIFKYQLIDIKIAVTRIGVFIAVYSIVLGIPFALAFGCQEVLMRLIGEKWWLMPLISSTALATAGPFIYLYIQKKAEDRLLQEQRRYQMTLRQASSGMSRIKDLRKLLKLIVHIITRTVHIEHSSMYLFSPIEKKYLLEASRSNGKLKSNGVVDPNSPLISYLAELKESVVYDEVKQRTQDYNDARLAKVESQMRDLDAAVVVPSFVEEKLLALVILGKKNSGKLYSQDDLAVFSILANQAALAIENAQFYEDVKRTQEQLFQAEKMATIGTMADGLSHQINNRLHALGFIAGDALDNIKMRDANVSPDMKEFLTELKRSLEKIQDNVKQGGEVVQGLLRYTRKGDAGLAEVDFDQLVSASIEMAQYKVKLDQITIVRDYEKSLPKISGNFTQLQEVFFNLIDNAYDAMMQRKNEKKEPGYAPKLTISAQPKDNMVQVTVLDNGIGVKDEDSNKIFTPFFTTKLSSRKGTGLGLYVIQKIIEENHKGKVSFSSEYMTGTLFTIMLPLVTHDTDGKLIP